MPRSSAGKWVARAGATGGGRTYRGQMPVNWYAALVIIVILGIASVVYSRYEYRHAAAASTTPPAKGTTWYAAYGFDICGTVLSPLPSNATDPTKQSFYTSGTGVITVSPKSASDAGTNAVLGKFVAGYKGLALSATEVKIPSSASATTTTTTTTSPSTTTTKPGSTTSRTYSNGTACPAGTKDAGKKADVVVTYWSNAFASTEKPVTATGNPATIKFTDNQVITIGFVPAGTVLQKNGTAVAAMLKATTGSSTTTPTSAATTPATTTTAPGTATTSATTTTVPATTTTVAPATTTTSPKSK